MRAEVSGRRRAAGRTVDCDRDTDTHLSELGSRVVRVWEYGELEHATDLVEAAVRSRLAGS